MKIDYTARKVVLRDNFKDMVEKKLSKFSKMFSQEAVAHVTVTVEKNRQTVEITINDKGFICRSEHTCKEMNTALDEVIDNLGRQVRKNKTKLSQKVHDKAAMEKFISEIQDSTMVSEPEEDYKIVRQKSFIADSMEVDEAILQMNMLSHSFFIFKNSRTGKLNVVYKRNNDTYGVLAPED